ncbi:MAG: Holliday junction resolvase RuvX [Clostridia bacterium]|nr:Holliday junction resolvase RuvX [Clostridia bacterium]
MRIMALDYGDARTGVAISDALGITAQGLESIDSNNKFKLMNRIAEIIKEYAVEKIVIGYPLNMNATVGPRAQKTDSFIKELESRFHLEVIKVDERLTTVASHRTMTELGIKKEKKKQIVDTMSAVYILQMYLDKI